MSRIVGVWVSTFFVMLRDVKKQGGEWYFMKGGNAEVKRSFFCTFVKRSG